MVGMIQLTLWICAFSLAPILATAAPGPTLDPEIKTFLRDSRVSESATLPVVLVYRDSQKTPDRPLELAQRSSWVKAQIERTQSSQDALLRRLGASLNLEPLWMARASLGSLSRSDLARLTSDPHLVSIRWARRPIRLADPQAREVVRRTATYPYGLERIGARRLKELRPELDGNGVRLGILDSGLEPTHPVLNGKTVVFRDFTPGRSAVPSDSFGHGTHVAGTIAGGSNSGIAIGIAPAASLVIGKIFDGNGDSDHEQILRAMQWIADPDGNPDTRDEPRAVNNSWGDGDPFTDRDPQDEPFCRIVNSWISLGVVPVFSAGNNGPSRGTIGLPAGCPNAFAVGATEQTDRSPWFSSAGPARWKSMEILKPEICAPGLDIHSAKPGGGYQLMTGTSMAAPHATGSLGLLFQSRTDLGPEEAANILKLSAKDLGPVGQDPDFGWGRVDLVRSLSISRTSVGDASMTRANLF